MITLQANGAAPEYTVLSNGKPVGTINNTGGFYVGSTVTEIPYFSVRDLIVIAAAVENYTKNGSPFPLPPQV